ASASPTADAQVDRLYQSNSTGVTPGDGGPGWRLAARTETPAAASAAVTRRPAIPVAPSIHTVIVRSLPLLSTIATPRRRGGSVPGGIRPPLHVAGRRAAACLPHSLANDPR